MYKIQAATTKLARSIDLLPHICAHSIQLSASILQMKLKEKYSALLRPFESFQHRSATAGDNAIESAHYCLY
jgi:hypothetical protein